MSSKRYPEIINEAVEEIAKWVREVTRIREEDIGDIDQIRNTAETNAALLPAPGTSGNVLTSDGSGWVSSTPTAATDATVTFTDITTNNASTTKHGFLKKLSNIATEYMDGTGAWSVPPRTVIGRAYTEYTSASSLSTTMPIDDTIPQNTEGDEIITLAYTAASATNRLRFTFSGCMVPSSNVNSGCALFWDSVAGALFATLGAPAFTASQGAINVKWTWEFVPGDTSSHTYKIRVGANSGTLKMNSTTTAAGRVFGGVAATSLTIEEIKP